MSVQVVGSVVTVSVINCAVQVANVMAVRIGHLTFVGVVVAGIDVLHEAEVATKQKEKLVRAKTLADCDTCFQMVLFKQKSPVLGHKGIGAIPAFSSNANWWFLFRFGWAAIGWACANKAGRLGSGSIPGSGHSEDLKFGICGLSSFVIGINGWVQGTVHARRCHWLATSAAFTAKAAPWPTRCKQRQMGAADHSWLSERVQNRARRKLNGACQWKLEHFETKRPWARWWWDPELGKKAIEHNETKTEQFQNQHSPLKVWWTLTATFLIQQINQTISKQNA